MTVRAGRTSGSPVTGGRYAVADDRRTGRTCRPTALALAALTLTGACGGGDDDVKRASVGATTTTTEAATSATTAPTSTPAPTTAAARGVSTTTVPTTTTTARLAPAAGLTFTTPGIYRYATTGQFTSALTGTQARDGEATLTVDPPSGTDQRSVRRGAGRSTEQVLRLDGAGAYVVSLRLTDTGIDKEVRPSPPGLALPADAAPGRAWAWRAVSTDAKTTVDSSFKVVRSEDVTVGSDRVAALVLEVVLTLSGDVVSTSRQTLWVSTRHRLMVRQDETTDGRLGLITFSSTSSDTLLSLTPG